MRINWLRICIGVVLLLGWRCALAVTDGEQVYQAYITDNMRAWKRIIDVEHARSGKSLAQEMELLDHEYGYINRCLSKKWKDEAELYVERHEARIERLKSQRENASSLAAYESACYGFKIALNKLKAPFLGDKSYEAALRSVHLNRQNGFGYLQLGNTKFYKPGFLGGSKEEALKYYLRAEKLMPRSENMNDWHRLELLMRIALTYEALGNIRQANNYYLKILKEEPNIRWIRDDLYPKFKRSHNLNL